ncbi:MAG: hypothetical protein ACI81V_001406 [Lentimonas sp.]|jgi:hypothetical protein
MSLRATGEAHISSIEFRVGVIAADGKIHVEPPTEYVTTPEIHVEPSYNKQSFLLKPHEMGFNNEYAEYTLRELGETFTLAQ